MGPPKTGTSFLQEVWWHNRDLLARQGVLYPGDEMLSHFRAAAVLRGTDRVTQGFTQRQLHAWDRMLTEIGRFDGDALLSTERFAAFTSDQVDRTLHDLRAVSQEVHVMATARDLARQVPSSWQQRIKRNRQDLLDEWWRRLAAEPDHPFWTFHDLADVLGRWSRDLPSDHVHLVVHGRPGTPPERLLEQTCGVVGIDPGPLSPTGRDNESLGAAQVELLRRINAQLAPERDQLEMARLTKSFFTRRVLLLAGTPEQDRFVLAPEGHEWAVRRGRAMVEQLRGREYDVVGELADLLPGPRPPAGRQHTDVTDAEVAELATTVLARMLEHQLAAGEELQELRRTSRRERRDQAAGSPAGGVPAPPRAAALRAAVRRLRPSRG